MGHYRFHSYNASSEPAQAPVFSFVEDAAGLGRQAEITVIVRSATGALATGDHLFIRFVAARVLAEETQDDAFGRMHLSLDARSFEWVSQATRIQ